jgi:23S rRNA (cytidine2498-2'-O)-methyltransferase
MHSAVARRTLVAYCRAGFEAEAAADLRRIAARAGFGIEPTAVERAAYAAGNVDAAERLRDPHRWPSPIFARSVIDACGPIVLTAESRRRDRVTPLLHAIERFAPDGPQRWRSVWVEYPDTNEGKALAKLAGALERRLATALQASLDDAAPRRLHVFLPDGERAYVGESDADRTRWPLGIPRLRRVAGAPSRSAAKLVEAFVVFLGDREPELLRPGMRAVDLGAAPGGWTWVLAQRGVRVEAVDNGPLKGAVATDPLVRHLRVDGLTFRPKRPVDWLVCDIVEQPIRIAELCATWVVERYARRAIFNLKLPMKRRYDEVRRCEARIRERLGGIRAVLAFRHLYHDREEITGYLAAS